MPTPWEQPRTAGGQKALEEEKRIEAFCAQGAAIEEAAKAARPEREKAMNAHIDGLVEAAGQRVRDLRDPETRARMAEAHAARQAQVIADRLRLKALEAQAQAEADLKRAAENEARLRAGVSGR